MNAKASRRKTPRCGVWLTLASLCLLAVPPAAAGEAVASGQVVALEASTSGSASQSGLVLGLHSSRDQGTAIPEVTITGGTIRWTQADFSGPGGRLPDGSTWSTSGLLRSFDLEPEPAARQDHHAQFTATAAQGAYTIHIYARDALQSSASMSGFTARSIQTPHFDKEEGIRAAEPTDTNNDEDAYTFHQFRFDAPLVRTQPLGGSSISLRGDFVVEIWGLNGTIEGDGGSRTVYSGSWTEPLHSTGPREPVYRERYAFVRMRVEGGTANLTFTADTATHWGGPAASAAVSAPVTFSGATGALVTADGDRVAVQGSSYVLDGRNSLALAPAPEGLAVAVTGLDAEGRPLDPDAATAQRLPHELLMWVALLALSAAALGVGAWALHRRLRHVPTMSEVEALLEAGQYRRAAREAARILRSKPGMETAVISRAIALSKAGRNDRVVAEVEEYLKRTDPSDGVLHYVLGVAYHDLGHSKSAEAAFQEALSRTPELTPQVEGRLPAGSRSAMPLPRSPVEPNGYA